MVKQLNNDDACMLVNRACINRYTILHSHLVVLVVLPFHHEERVIFVILNCDHRMIKSKVVKIWGEDGECKEVKWCVVYIAVNKKYLYSAVASKKSRSAPVETKINYYSCIPIDGDRRLT